MRSRFLQLQRQALRFVICYGLLLLALPASAWAQATGGYSVQIQGAGALADLLTEYLEINRHTADKDISVPELQRLVAITPDHIRQLLATEGYFSPQIEPQLLQADGRWIARFRISPGEPVRVTAVDIRFNGHIAGETGDQRRMNQLRRNWNLPAGSRFQQEGWEQAKNDLLKALLVKDYPAATIIASEARVDPQQLSAILKVEVDSGPAFTFGELQIEGLERYSRRVIEPLNPIHPGDPFSQEKLNELQARLQDTGYFRSVFATIEADPDSPERVPVLVSLTENERKRLSLGIGFSTDTGARGQIKWMDRNLFGRNWRLESELRVDRETNAVGGDVFFPALRSGWYPSIGANYEQSNIAGERNDKVRVRARLNRLLGRSEKAWGIAYFSDEQRIGNAVINHRQALLGTYGYTRRRVDSPLTPRRGHVTSIELGVGLGGVLAEEDIARVLGQTTWLIPLGQRWTGILRGQVGQVSGASRESVPADLLFRTGGDQSVRGYKFNALGVEQEGAVVGGTVLAVASAELIYHLTPQWGLAVFTDAGNAADSWKDFRLQHGSGIGARWRSPIGSINLDLAYGHETRKQRIHFSVGYGF